MANMGARTRVKSGFRSKGTIIPLGICSVIPPPLPERTMSEKPRSALDFVLGGETPDETARLLDDNRSRLRDVERWLQSEPETIALRYARESAEDAIKLAAAIARLTAERDRLARALIDLRAPLAYVNDTELVDLIDRALALPTDSTGGT